MPSRDVKVAQSPAPHKGSFRFSLQPDDVALTERIAANAAVLRFALRFGKSIPRQTLAVLCEDMEAWAAELARPASAEPADMRDLVRRTAA